jgi:hypothetical protein
MTGTQPERNLLGALLLDNSQFARVDGLVTADDFIDGRLGEVFLRSSQLVSRGDHVDTAVVNGRLPEWNVYGLDTEPFTWTNDVYQYAAPDYARAVRADAVRHKARNIITVLTEALNDGVEPIDVVSNAHMHMQDLIDNTARGSMTFKTLADVLEGDDTYDWLIPGLLERKDRVIFTGPEGSGKTTLCRQIVVLAAAGIHPFTFAHIPPIRVLVIDAENTEKQWRRAVRWSVNRAREYRGIDPAPLVEIQAGPRIDITRGSQLADIHRKIDQFKPDLLYIGPLYKMVPKSITNDDDAAPLIVALDSLRDRGVTLLMEAHAGKAANAAGERDLRPRGSAALLGWPEFGLGIRPDPEWPSAVDVVRWRGDRDQRDWPRKMVRGTAWPWEPVAS